MAWSDEYGAKYEVIRERYSSDLQCSTGKPRIVEGRDPFASGYSHRAPLSMTRQGLHPVRRSGGSRSHHTFESGSRPTAAD